MANTTTPCKVAPLSLTNYPYATSLRHVSAAMNSLALAHLVASQHNIDRWFQLGPTSLRTDTKCTTSLHVESQLCAPHRNSVHGGTEFFTTQSNSPI
jgi:hypothetical protein